MQVFLMARETCRLTILVKVLTGVCLVLPVIAAMLTVPYDEDDYFWVTPSDEDVLAGDQLILTCTLNPELIKVNSSCLYFTKRFPNNGTSCPEPDGPTLSCKRRIPHVSSKSPYKQCAISSKFVTVINSTSIRLHYTVEVPDLDESQYHCRALDGSNFERGSVFVRMYSPSAAVSNVSCFVENVSSSPFMTCQWAPPKEGVHQVNLTWGIDGDPTIPCPDLGSSQTTCKWSAGQFSMGSVYTMMITVMTVSSTGETLDAPASEKFNIDTNLHIRPPPVSRLRSDNINSTCIWLSWQNEVNLDVECQIVYNCSEYQTECQVVENVTSSEVQICDLWPLTLYQWNVSCRPIIGGHWSPNTSHTSKTISDFPWAPPEVHPGSFREEKCDEPNCRTIILYWRKLPPHLRNGDLETYHIYTTDIDLGHWDTIIFNYTDQTSHKFPLRQDKNYRIQINACTKKGCSNLSTPINILKQRKVVPTPRGFSVEMANNTELSVLNMSWMALPDSIGVVSYTIFWCKGTLPNCKTSLNWDSVSSKTSAYNLTLPGVTEDNLREYMVGVSAEAKLPDGSRRKRRMVDSDHVTSSGIAWSPCLYGQSTVPKFTLENVRKSWSPTSDSVEIIWDKLTCQHTPSLLTGVLVVYCPTNGGSECSGPKKNTTAPGLMPSYTLTGLESGGTYQIVLYAMTRAGTGPPSQPLTVKVKPDLQVLYVVIITFAVLLLILLIVFFTLWAIRHMWDTREKITIVGEEKLLEKEDGSPSPSEIHPLESRSSIRKEPESPEVVMRPKPNPPIAVILAHRQIKSNPPEVAPKPVVRAKYSMYGRIETSDTQYPPPPSVTLRSSSQNTDYVRYHRDIPPPPPLNPPPESRSSIRNGSYKQKNEEKDIENVQLLRADFYKENPSSRSSAPVRVDNCYMVPQNTRPHSRHSKRNSENNNNPPIVTGLEAKSDDSFPLLDFTDEGIPRERVSSFKGHLVAKDYGFAVKGQIDYEDLVNAQLEKGKAASQESIGKDSRRNKSPSDKHRNKKHGDGSKSHKKTHSVSFSEEDYNAPTPAEGQPVQAKTQRDGWKPSKKERRWSRSRPDSDGHKYSDSGRQSPRRPSPDKRLSRDSDFPTPPPTPPAYTGREHRFSGQDFFPTPPPPPIYDEHQQAPQNRFSGQFFPTPPPPPIDPRDEYHHESRPPAHAHGPLPSPKHRTKEVKTNPQLRNHPTPHEVQPEVRLPPQEHGPIPSPKHRTKEIKPEAQQRHQPVLHEALPVFRYPSQEHVSLPSPKHRTREIKPEAQERSQPSPREVEPVFRYPSQEHVPAPRAKESKPEPLQRHPAPRELKSPITPDRLSKTLSEADPDSTLDISFLLGDLLGGGVTVRPKTGNAEDVMRPKPRQQAPTDQVKTGPESPEVVMRPKPSPQAAPEPGDRQSRAKSNPPKVAPKPVVKTTDSMYGRLETNPTQYPPPPSVTNRSSSQNPDYVRYA